MSNPLPSGELFPVFGAGLGAETGIDTGITFFTENPKMPYMQRWQMGIQRQLPGDFLVELSYVGNRGTRIEIDARHQRDLEPVPEHGSGSDCCHGGE